MASAANQLPANGNANGYEVRVWGMDLQDKPFIQFAVAQQVSERGVLLDGVIPVKAGDTIGVQYQKQKARYKVTSVAQEDDSMRRKVDIECLEAVNIWGFPIAIRRNEMGIAAQYGETKQGIRQTDVPQTACLPNRRTGERFKCRISAEVLARDSVSQVFAPITDISEFGCYLEFITPFAVGSKLTISIRAVDFGISTTVRVHGIARTSHPMVGMGVEFQNVLEADRLGLQMIIAKLSNAAPNGMIASVAPEDVQPMAIVKSPVSELSAKAEQTRRAGMDLHQLEMSLTSADMDTRLLQEFREASTHARQLLTLVQQWLDLKEKGRDPFMVLPAVTSERVRFAAALSRNISIDLETLEINHETPGFKEMRAHMKAANERLTTPATRH